MGQTYEHHARTHVPSVPAYDAVIGPPAHITNLSFVHAKCNAHRDRGTERHICKCDQLSVLFFFCYSMPRRHCYPPKSIRTQVGRRQSACEICVRTQTRALSASLLIFIPCNWQKIKNSNSTVVLLNMLMMCPKWSGSQCQGYSNRVSLRCVRQLCVLLFHSYLLLLSHYEDIRSHCEPSGAAVNLNSMPALDVCSTPWNYFASTDFRPASRFLLFFGFYQRHAQSELETVVARSAILVWTGIDHDDDRSSVRLFYVFVANVSSHQHAN